MSYNDNLPPGCTPDDIDIDLGVATRCWTCLTAYGTQHASCPRCAAEEARADRMRDEAKDEPRVWEDKR